MGVGVGGCVGVGVGGCVGVGVGVGRCGGGCGPLHEFAFSFLCRCSERSYDPGKFHQRSTLETFLCVAVISHCVQWAIERRMWGGGGAKPHLTTPLV